MNRGGITGPGSNYFQNMNPDAYRARVNTPAKNPEYFRKFHQLIIDRAKVKFGIPIRVLDIACGPADELDFIKGDKDVQIIATDISPAILSSVKAKLGDRAEIFASDSSFPAIRENIAEVGMLVNAMIYVPDKMLSAMHRGLKQGGECAVNFRIFSNPNNKVFYDYYIKRGGKILDRELVIETAEGPKTLQVKVLDYTECLNDDGTPDIIIRQLAQQMYFQSVDDVKELIKITGFEELDHSKFDFASPVNPNNQVDVFIIKKP